MPVISGGGENMDTIHHTLGGRHLLMLLLLIFMHSTSSAMIPVAPEGRSVTVSIEGLTPEMRDGITRDLAGRNDLRLVYACVPAGILVFESSMRDTDHRTAISSVLERRVTRQRISYEQIDRTTVEQRCAEIRHQ